MSQKPAPSRPVVAPTRVSGGIPWWLWLILVVFGVFVVTTLVRKTIPEDPQLYVQEGMAAIENADLATIERSVQKLKDFPEYAPEQKLLEGMMYLGKSKPLLAIPFLEYASKNPKTRIKALTQLGNAYMRSHRRAECIAAYEAALKDDENTDDARLSLAYVLKDMISWDESLKHLTTLVDRKFNPGVVHQLMADIYADMGDYAKAATSYEAALVADPTSPTNSTKASRLIACRLETGNLEGIEGYLQGVDAAGVRESARALALAAKDETKQALSALDQALLENPNDITANVTYGKIMAGIGTKEKAAEALVSLQKLTNIHSRNLDLFEIVAKLGTIAEDEKIAVIAQQNVDQLKDLETQFAARLNEVIKTREGAQARIELGDLAAATGHMELARSIYQSAFVIDDKMEGVVTAKVQSLFVAQPPLVSMGNGSAGTQTEPPADPAPEVTPDPAPTPEPEKAATPEPDAAAKSDESAKAGTDAAEPAPK